MKKKDMYVSPRIEVIEMQNEGVIAASNSVTDYPNVPMSSTRPGGGYRGGNASSGDLEDMINNILTVGE